MKPVIIDDIDWIVLVMEEQQPIVEVYLDLLEGEIASTEIGNLSAKRLSEDPDRYFPITPFPSSEGYRVMEDFVREQVNEEDIADRLCEAISQNKPFRRFRDEIRLFPEISERYESYKFDRMKSYLVRTLASSGYRLEERKSTS